MGPNSDRSEFSLKDRSMDDRDFQGVKYLIDLLNLKQIGEFLLEDLTSSWRHILISFALAAVISVRLRLSFTSVD